MENVLKLYAPLHCTAVHNFHLNVENASLFLSGTCLRKLSKIAQYSKDLRIAGYLSHSLRILQWPEPAKF